MFKKSYKKYLSNYLIFRFSKYLLILCYQFLILVLSKTNSSSVNGLYRFTRLDNFIENFSVDFISVYLPSSSTKNSIEFYGLGAEHSIFNNGANPAKEFVDVAVLRDASIVSNSHFVFFEDLAIHHNLFSPVDHEWPGMVSGHLKKIESDHMSIKVHLFKSLIYLDRGVSLFGDCNENYAHFITETLVKLSIYDRVSDFVDWPIIVEKRLHKNQVELLKFFNRNNREIIFVDSWQPVEVSSLLYVEAPGFERYLSEKVFVRDIIPFFNKFDRNAFSLMRKNFFELIQVDLRKQSPVSVYVMRGRKSLNLRILLNEDEIIQYVKSKGFIIVDPEKMTIMEQLKIFSRANVIICPVGAALANMVFVPDDCAVLAFAPFHDGANVNYFGELSRSLDLNVTFLFGTIHSSIQSANGNYYVDISEIEKFLARFCI